MLKHLEESRKVIFSTQGADIIHHGPYAQIDTLITSSLLGSSGVEDVLLPLWRSHSSGCCSSKDTGDPQTPEATVQSKGSTPHSGMSSAALVVAVYCSILDM